ncbi:hypothetical protein [Streptomyces sp. NPDC020742]|uniref:hypothetical protein n=1 Tax=unclassified Streptomyces TaxID=2593676 RepID=UPI0034064B2B
MTDRFTRALALGAAGVALAGGAVFATAAGAAAAPSHDDDNVAVQQIDRGDRCHVMHRHWIRVWHPAWRDRRGHRHPGYWTRDWRQAHLVCHHRR